MNKCTERLYNGLVKENPTFVLMLGMCPTLAVTTSAINGIGMGLSTTVVLDHVQHVDFYVEKDYSGFCQNAGIHRYCCFFRNNCTVPDGRIRSKPL